MGILYRTVKYLGFLILPVLVTLQAQSQSSIRGLVQESSGKPVAFANVLLLNAADSSLVKGMVTTEIGFYSLEDVKLGKYLLAASMVGYKQIFTAPFTIHDQTDLQIKTVVLEEDVQQLAEVVVEAQKPLYEQQLDKLVVNVQSSITSAGATALDVLERSPGVAVNRQNNSISLVGKYGVMVMINGKSSRLPMEAVLQMLSGMNANNIEKIELITTPSANYDAEGNAGIINILLKKDSEYGTNGSYSLTFGYGRYEKPAGSFSINHRTPRLNIFGDFSFLWNHSWQELIFYRSLHRHNGHSQFNSLAIRNIYYLNHNARLGFEYEIGAKTSLAGQVAGFSNKFKMDASNHSDMHQSLQLATLLQMNNDEINHWRHLMGNLNLRHRFTKNQQVSVDLDYLYYHNNNPSQYYNHFEYVEENRNEQQEMKISKLTPILLWVGKADYINNIGKETKLEAGLKTSFSRLQNNVLVEKLQQDVWITDKTLSQNVNMQEDIGAAYVNFQHQFDSKIKLQTGLRWEYTHTDLSSAEQKDMVKRRYGIFFPSVSISKAMGNQNSLQFSYSRRITRPTYNQLAPFFAFYDPYTYYVGNTSLKPAITDAVQASFQLQNSCLLSLQYSHDENSIIGYQIHVDPKTNIQYAHAANVERANTISLMLSLPFTIGSWWQMQNSLMGVWQQNVTDYEGALVESSNRYGRINSTQTFSLPYGFTAELTCFYQSSTLWGNAVFKAFGSLTAGLQKKLNHDQGVLLLSVDDLFWTNITRFGLRVNTAEVNMTTGLRFVYEPRVVRLTYTRNFGNKNVKSTKRSTGSEEERKRVSG